MNDLGEKIRKYQPNADLSLVEKAYNFAAKAHQQHKRLSGEPYITHPLAVANILADLEQDPITIAAALLHDVLEDADVTREELTKEFGPEVVRLVEGVTKLSQLTFVSHEEKQAENFRKMFVAMGEDFRIIIIKLADRMHNMQTLQYLSPAKQQETSLETREIFAPLAHRMGMWRIKWQLEDLSFLYLEPEKYDFLRKNVAVSRSERESYIDEFISALRELVAHSSLKADINGRAKHFYSIHNKMTNQHLAFEEIYDLTAVRVIVDNIKECYTVLGLVHDTWKPIPGRFRDYIAMPKSNGYQSLHTTVFGPSGRPVEIQIRTKEMHKVAEYGVAAHWRYKEGATDKLLDQKMSWLRQMLEWQSELKDAKDFMESLKIDLAAEEVFVFSPKGHVFALPAGATPIDFAYRVHTEIGHRCVGAKVNGRIVPLNSPLQNGDIVEVITGKKDSPSKDWLNFVKTTGAKVKIKNWQRKQLETHPEAKEEPVAKITPEKVKPMASRPRGKSKVAVRVAGETDISVRYAKCCHPLPGEAVVGFVSTGRGIAVHRANCPNLAKKDMSKERMLRVEWDPEAKQMLPVVIEIEAFDRVGLFKDILVKISELGTNVSAGKAATRRRGTAAIIRLTIEVRDVNHLQGIMEAIRQAPDVYDIKRI